MPNFIAGLNTVIYYGGTNLTPYFNSVDTERSVVELKNTTFGQSSETRQPGIADGSAKLSGYYDGDVAGARVALEAALGSNAGEPISLGMGGDGLIGNPCYIWLNRLAKISLKSAIGGLVSVDGDLMPALGGIAPGVWLHPLTAVGAGASGTAVNGGVATSAGWRAALHVTAISGATATLTCKVQDSADNVTYADLVTFSAVTTVSGLYLASALGATVRQYVRSLWTLTGTSPSATFALSFARS
jgi:hypothetical protein